VWKCTLLKLIPLLQNTGSNNKLQALGIHQPAKILPDYFCIMSMQQCKMHALTWVPTEGLKLDHQLDG
ncbi:hypothetical protein FRX31_025754, partial [Thalictrum thalictroides]